jgi:methyltransferase-like protein
MITVAQRKKLKKVFKNGYSQGVKAILEEKKIVNKKGNPFSESYINHVFNGRNTNDAIEEAIFELYQKRLCVISEKKQLRNQIL